MAGLTVYADPAQQRFEWPVKVVRAVDNDYQEFRFTATFKRMTTDEHEDWERGRVKARDVMRAHLVGWEGLTDERDKELAFSEANRELVLQDPDILIGLGQALAEAGRGWKAERKN